MERVGEILKSVLDAELSATGRIWHRFFSSWNDLVGPDLAGFVRLVEVERGEAVVHVDHPAAAQLLGLRKDAILARIRVEFPEVMVRAFRVLMRPRPAGPG